MCGVGRQRHCSQAMKPRQCALISNYPSLASYSEIFIPTSAPALEQEAVAPQTARSHTHISSVWQSDTNRLPCHASCHDRQSLYFAPAGDDSAPVFKFFFLKAMSSGCPLTYASPPREFPVRCVLASLLRSSATYAAGVFLPMMASYCFCPRSWETQLVLFCAALRLLSLVLMCCFCTLQKAAVNASLSFRKTIICC